MDNLIEDLQQIQESCRYEREISPTSSFHCYDVTGGYFDNIIVKQAKELEQRYQQLEQFVKEMYQALNLCPDGCFEGCPMLNDGCDVASGILRVQLEALGVSLDG